MSPALTRTDIAALAGRPSLPALAGIAVRVAVVVVTWDLRRKTRAALRRLDAHELHDIGLTADIARLEAARPFWQA